MKKKLTLFILVLSLLSSLTFCSKKEQEAQTVFAIVNQEAITEELVSEYLQQFNEDDSAANIAKDKLINIFLLAQEFDLLDPDAQKQIEARINLSEKIIKANAFLAYQMASLEIAEEELFDYYQVHKAKFTKELDEYRVQRILLGSVAEADTVTAMITGNVINFTEAARRYSRERTSANDGYMGYMTLTEMDGGLRRLVESLNQWYFGRLNVSNGVYLIRYTDVRSRNVEQLFTEVREECEQLFLEEKRRDLAESVVNNLMDKSNIIITQ